MPSSTNSEESRTAIYARVTTEDQNLDRQLESAHEYAQDTIGSDLNEITVFRDKSTGTDT